MVFLWFFLYMSIFWGLHVETALLEHSETETARPGRAEADRVAIQNFMAALGPGFSATDLYKLTVIYIYIYIIYIYI